MSGITVSFENWEKVLRETVPVQLHASSREAIVKFRHLQE